MLPEMSGAEEIANGSATGSGQYSLPSLFFSGYILSASERSSFTQT